MKEGKQVKKLSPGHIAVEIPGEETKNVGLKPVSDKEYDKL